MSVTPCPDCNRPDGSKCLEGAQMAHGHCVCWCRVEDHDDDGKGPCRQCGSYKCARFTPFVEGP